MSLLLCPSSFFGFEAGRVQGLQVCRVEHNRVTTWDVQLSSEWGQSCGTEPLPCGVCVSVRIELYPRTHMWPHIYGGATCPTSPFKGAAVQKHLWEGSSPLCLLWLTQPLCSASFFLELGPISLSGLKGDREQLSLPL